MNWTKTLALWILTAALSVLFALLCSDLLIPITCQSRQSVNVDQASKIPRSVVINGYVVSLDSIKADSIKQAISKYSGRDVSDMFPQFLSLSGSRANNGATFTDVDMQRCFGARKAQAFAWQEARMKSGGYSLQNKTLTQCPAPDGSKSQCFTLADDSDSITKAIVAGNKLTYTFDQHSSIIYCRHFFQTRSIVCKRCQGWTLIGVNQWSCIRHR